MNKNKKYIAISFLTILILIGGFSYINSSKVKDVPVIESDNNQSSTYLNTNLNTNEQKKVSEIPIQKVNKSENPLPLTDTNNINVSLTVDDKKYETSIKEGSTVFNAMEKIKNESTPDNIFDFKYTSNIGLGNFITEINGKYGTPGKYWIYYVNNEKASIGVSNYILKEGDIINWSQEGI